LGGHINPWRRLLQSAILFDSINVKLLYYNSRLKFKTHSPFSLNEFVSINNSSIPTRLRCAILPYAGLYAMFP